MPPHNVQNNCKIGTVGHPFCRVVLIFFRNYNSVTISGSLMWWCETEMWGRDEGFWMKWGEGLYISSPSGRITQYVGASFISCSKYLNLEILIGCLGISILCFKMRWRLVYFIVRWEDLQYVGVSFITCSKYLNLEILIGCLGILIMSFTMSWRLVYFIIWWADHTNMSFTQVLESDILSARVLFEA